MRRSAPTAAAERPISNLRLADSIDDAAQPRASRYKQRWSAEYAPWPWPSKAKKSRRASARGTASQRVKKQHDDKPPRPRRAQLAA